MKYDKYFSVSDICDDIEDLNKDLKRNEDLYNEVYSIFHELSQIPSKGYRPMGGGKDIAELANTLGHISATHMSGIGKRAEIRRRAAELQNRLSGGDETAASSIAREMINLLKNPSQKIISPNSIVNDEKELEKRLEKDDIELNENEKEMPFTNKKIEIVYSKKEKKFKAQDSETQKILHDYPSHRIKEITIQKEEDGKIISTIGEEFNIV